MSRGFFRSVKVDDVEAKAVKNLNKMTGRPSQKRGRVVEGGEGSGRLLPSGVGGTRRGGAVQRGSGHVPSEQGGGDELEGGAVFSGDEAASERPI